MSMTTRHIIELETLSFVFAAAFLSAFLVWHNNKNFQEQFRASVPFNASNKIQTIISPMALNPAKNPIIKTETAEQISPDGTKKIIMKKTQNTDKTDTYVFTSTDGAGLGEKQLYTAKVENSETFDIPFNAWSPDNKYVFIIKNNNNALVFKATGEPVANSQPYFDVAQTFLEKGKKDTISEVTGWASETLLIVNTQTPENTKGPSYWFEVPSRAIIQLSSEF